MVMLIAAFMLALLPAVASAQEAEVEALRGVVGELEGETAEEWAESAAAADAALADLKAAAADLDYADLDAALADLNAAIEAGDLEAIALAGEAVTPAFDAVAAQAAAEGEGGETAAPTAVGTGDAVNGGPNVALLMMAAILALLAVGAFGLRWTIGRR
jgi:hypothetical protein